MPPAALALLTSLLVLGATAPAAHAQPEGESPIAFERAMDVERHLPQSSVYEILEDRRGFLWFATREGLGRWDGYTMRMWRVEPFGEASLPGNLITRMEEDGAGNLWVEASGIDRVQAGIARLVAPAHETVRRYGRPGARLVPGPEGVMWLADRDSLYRFDATLDRFVGVFARVEATNVRTGLTRHDGSIWLATRAPTLERYDPATGARRVVPLDRSWPAPERTNTHAIGGLYEDHQGTLWVTGSWLGRLDATETLVETVYRPTLAIEGNGIGLGASEMTEDDDGWLWLATLDGVYRFRSDAPERPERFSLLLPGDIHTQNYVVALHRDRAGALWAGTVWGLHRYDPHANHFRLFAHAPNDPHSLGSGLVLSLHGDAEGALWVGTLGGGLNRLDLATGRARRYPWHTDGGTSGSWIWGLTGDGNGTLWVATGTGLDRIDTRRPDRVSNVPVPVLSTTPESIYTPHLDALDGSLWTGQFGGLLHHTDRGDHQVLELPDSIYVTSILTDSSTVWAATVMGLYRIDRHSGAYRTYRHDPADTTSLSHDITICLFRDSRGQLWVGTNSGLNRYDPATDGFVHYTSADGLPSDVAYAILEDDDGRLWISTNRGLARLDERAPAGRRVRAFTLADGVGNVEFNQRAAFRGRDGTMYFGGDRGVTAFDPARIRDNPYRPPVVLTALHRSTRAGTETVRYLGTDPVEVAPDETTLTFEFAALSFTNPHHNQYAVMMEGFDMDWMELGTSRRSTYTNLPPGRYTFRVKASNEDGLWNEAGTAIPVIVHPRFFQTWWFRLLVVAAAFGVVALAGWSVSRRQYRRELARLKARQALDAERARISRDMHDEVGASLTEIAILSEIAQRELARSGGDGAPADRPPSAERLSRIADTSRAMLDAIGEIIWAINPQHDRLDRLSAYLREHAARVLEDAGLEARLSFPARVPDLPVTAEFRRNVFLVLKEALHNVIRHAGAHAVAVHLTLDDEGLALVIEDDGCGLPGDNKSPADRPSGRGGNGLGNMTHRAEEIGGTLDVGAAPGGGARLTLRAPLSPLHAIDAPPAARDV